MPPDTSQTDDQNQTAEAESWSTLRRFLPYLWPDNHPALKRRIIGAMMFVLAAKGVTLALPYAYKNAVDAMTTPDVPLNVPSSDSP